MADLYPDIAPYATHSFPVGGPHVLYVEECGSPDGLPVVFLHGGPGAGCEPVHRRFFDPTVYRIVLFDQRGCGRSRPHASLEDNTTWHLVEDIEFIRRQLGVEQWVVFGGSWGSTLALVYAETHPERVMGLILRGLFLCRPQEIDWFYQTGTRRLFPDAWSEFEAVIPSEERDDMVAAYYRRLTGDNELGRLRAARAWAVYEAKTACLSPNPTLVEQFGEAHRALSLARTEAHYFTHDCFLEPDQIVRDATRLADIPGAIVHGRYDVICPLDQVFELQAAWPAGVVQIIPEAGHAAGEDGIRQALVHATQDMARGLE
jgi:proline iminopeptidase